MKRIRYVAKLSFFPTNFLIEHVFLRQGYEDDPEDEEDASYADEEYGAAKKKAPKKRKAPSKPKGMYHSASWCSSRAER